MTGVGEPAIDRKRAELLEQLLQRRRAAKLEPSIGGSQPPAGLVAPIAPPMPTAPTAPTGTSAPAGAIEQDAPAPAGSADPAADPAFDPDRLRAELVAIWAEVFGLQADQYTEDQSFFEIGGTSMQAVRLWTRIQESFGIEIALAEIFARSSVAELTSCLEAILTGGDIEAGRGTEVGRDIEGGGIEGGGIGE